MFGQDLAIIFLEPLDDLVVELGILATSPDGPGEVDAQITLIGFDIILIEVGLHLDMLENSIFGF